MTISGGAPTTADPTAAGRRIAALWVLAMCSNLPIYVGTFVMPAIVPLHWIAALLLLTAMTLFVGDREMLDWPLTFPAVLLAYACLCLAWYVAQGGGDPVVLRQRLLGLGVCGVTYLVFSSSTKALLAARKSFMFIVLLSVAVNFWDITHPYSLIPHDSEFATVGRAAGFFINPNQAGAALVIGFVVTIAIVPEKWRVPYIVAVAAGVAITWSRAAILGFVLACIGLSVGKGLLSRRQVLHAALIGAALAWITWMLVAAEIQQRFNIDPAIVMDRVLWILDPSGRADFSQSERLYLMQRGLDQFYASPVAGNGIGSTELWAERTSTHNLYIMLASDFGVLGLFVLPVIVLAAMGSLPSRSREATVGGAFLLFWALFSHNVLGEFYLLIGIALLAAMAREAAAPLAADGRVVGANPIRPDLQVITR